MNLNSSSKENVFTVSEITLLLKDIIEGSFPAIIIEGEISNYRPNNSGHVYFTLKDEQSQISAVMFKSRAAGLNFTPNDGMKVRCKGQLSVYIPRGSYQIVITSMQPSGMGNILQMLDERKKKLSAEGLFESDRKKRIPVYPKTIGVVTSATGAALRDILQIIKRRNTAVSITILPATVQGEGAAETIVRQIEIANEYNLCDVLIVGRGGGSLEDLLPFSEETVIRAIADSVIPVVSAVGHEIDWALSDYVADVRAPTPSAAAELVTPVKSEIIEYLNQKITDFHNSIITKVEKLQLTIKTFNKENLELQFRTIEQPLLSRYDTAKNSLFENTLQKIKDTKQYIQNCIAILENASPQTILERGYSMVRNAKTGEIIQNANQTSTGTEIEIIPAHGKLTALVQNVTSNDD